MRKMLNTLYITNEKIYVCEENENILLKIEDEIVLRYPILDLENIICFSYLPISPAVIKICGERNIQIHFISPHGKYWGCFEGPRYGNIETIKKQFRISENDDYSLKIAKSIITTKTINQKNFLLRLSRNQEESMIKNDCELIKRKILKIEHCETYQELLGIEGDIANVYFKNFNSFLKNSNFNFTSRSKMPPRDPVNSLLSFFYTILTSEYISAIHAVGLDPQCGFLHRDKSGRNSLACDLMEELRAPLVDRFVISQINNRVISLSDFDIGVDNIPMLKVDSKKKLLNLWQERKNEELEHPFLKEKIKIGLIPYAQASLLSKVIRNELDFYPGFVWR